MILSFHPIIEADLNLLCAGRLPNDEDLAAIQKAKAVILPQGCGEPLYRMAKANCPHVFPNLDSRFGYPGKLNQIRLFRNLGLAHPTAELYADVDHYRRSLSTIALPAVVKLAWGGQGDTVFLAHCPSSLARILERIRAFEKTGQSGFLVQTFIPAEQRSLRVTAIGSRMLAYWRIQTSPEHFGTSIVHGARIDHDTAPELQAAARRTSSKVCARTGIQLAGFDFIFDSRVLAQGRIEPLILEINYFFGRSGLGGSNAYYDILIEQVDRWLAGLELERQLRNAECESP